MTKKSKPQLTVKHNTALGHTAEVSSQRTVLSIPPTHSVQKSNTPLTCNLNPRISGVQITHVSSSNLGTGNNPATVLSPDGQSFTVAIDTVGAYQIAVFVNQVPSTGPFIAVREVADGSPLLTTITDPNTRLGSFNLTVTP
jgi:hypothetical protein